MYNVFSQSSIVMHNQVNPPYIFIIILYHLKITTDEIYDDDSQRPRPIKTTYLHVIITPIGRFACAIWNSASHTKYSKTEYFEWQWTNHGMSEIPQSTRTY
jgi:hypothetical protein